MVGSEMVKFIENGKLASSLTKCKQISFFSRYCAHNFVYLLSILLSENSGINYLGFRSKKWSEI